MVHLGLAMNKIRQPALAQIVKLFPNLFSLDASFNDLCEMSSAMTWLTKLESLKILFLEGNPLILTEKYRSIIIDRIPYLKLLDGVQVTVDPEVLTEFYENKAKRQRRMN